MSPKEKETQAGQKNLPGQSSHDGVAELEKHFVEVGSPAVDVLLKRKLGWNNPDRQDVAQEIRLAVLESIGNGGYNPEKGDFGAFVYGVARNKIKDYWKDLSKRSRLDGGNHLPEGVVPPPSTAESEERLRILRREISSLNDQYRRLLYLRYFDHLSYEEIAEMEGIENQQVRSKISEARKQLRVKLKKKKYFLTGIYLLLI